MRTFRFFLLILFTFIVTCAWADLLPRPRPDKGGGQPGPRERSQEEGKKPWPSPERLGGPVLEARVFMAAADVQVRIKKMAAAAGAKESQLLAEVTAEFDMVCSDAPQEGKDLDVVFPLAYEGERPGAPVRFAVTIDGKPAADAKPDTWSVMDKNHKPRTQWGYAWRLQGLKAGQKQRIEVRYSFVLPQKQGKAQFIYFLRSGALWHSPIGREVVKVTADNGLRLQVLSPTVLKPTQKSDTFLIWRITNARPDEDIRLSIVPDPSS